MKVRLESNGEITLDIAQIIDALDSETRERVVQDFCMNEGVLSYVISHLMHDYSGTFADPHIHAARLDLVSKIPNIAAATIETLVRECERAKEQGDRAFKYATELVSKWPYTPGGSRPAYPDAPILNTPTSDRILAKCLQEDDVRSDALDVTPQ